MKPEAYGDIVGLKIVVAMLLKIIVSKFPDEASGIGQTAQMCHNSVEAYPLDWADDDLAASIRGRAAKLIDDVFSAPVRG